MGTTLVQLYVGAVTANAIAVAILAYGWAAHAFNRSERTAIVVFTTLSVFLWAAYFAMRKRHVYR
jgi:hypothetical protein